MKKFFGVIVAVMLCVCMLVPTAVAADESITDLLEGVDLGGLTADDLESILGDLDLEDVDLEAIVDSFEGDDSISVDQIEGALKDMNSVQASNSGDGTSANSFDLTSIVSMIPVEEETASLLTSLVGALSDGGIESLMSSVAGTFSGNGIDLASYETGEFNISNLAAAATQATATIADMLFSCLESLGLDTTTIEGLLDNDIVNFFANMYIGFVGKVEESTTVPPVVTTTPPKTGDTSAVLVALGTLTVASGAAFVCLKKKKEEE